MYALYPLLQRHILVLASGHNVLTYRIMQIVRGGKVSRLAELCVIRVKTLAIVQQFETPYNKKEKICWKTFAIGG